MAEAEEENGAEVERFRAGVEGGTYVGPPRASEGWRSPMAETELRRFLRAAKADDWGRSMRRP